MKKIIVKAPAKVNLTLEVLNKREDGFHNIQSIMHTINLFDYLTIEVEFYEGIVIELSGNSTQIPYDASNLVYKACNLFLEYSQINNVKIKIYIEKNIPISAGLAGGSTDAVATLKGLNELFENVLDNQQMNEICAKLGSDLNFALVGGCCLCTSRGEVIEKLPNIKSSISLVKPKQLGISAKEAYQKCTQRGYKQGLDYTSKMKQNILCGKNFDKTLIINDLQKALVEDYKELSHIVEKCPNCLMTGSGSTFFVLEEKLPFEFNNDKYDIYENLELI
ncbi:4-(cytidine 5'-diphospho)-2-C-methyl-D-erythritol kinase [bacterium]|nr:4-(cytidine 5'-diphospho)-2-C-methyl-D-erythritol kinase [bacterium]